jgi:hypothetical protein
LLLAVPNIIRLQIQHRTNKIKQRGSGAINIEDERTGNKVTLQSSEIEKITKDQFNLGVISQGSEATK